MGLGKTIECIALIAATDRDRAAAAMATAGLGVSLEDLNARSILVADSHKTVCENVVHPSSKTQEETEMLFADEETIPESADQRYNADNTCTQICTRVRLGCYVPPLPPSNQTAWPDDAATACICGAPFLDPLPPAEQLREKATKLASRPRKPNPRARNSVGGFDLIADESVAGQYNIIRKRADDLIWIRCTTCHRWQHALCGAISAGDSLLREACRLDTLEKAADLPTGESEYDVPGQFLCPECQCALLGDSGLRTSSTLCICPPHILEQWKREIKKHCKVHDTSASEDDGTDKVRVVYYGGVKDTIQRMRQAVNTFGRLRAKALKLRAHECTAPVQAGKKRRRSKEGLSNDDENKSCICEAISASESHVGAYHLSSLPETGEKPIDITACASQAAADEDMDETRLLLANLDATVQDLLIDLQTMAESLSPVHLANADVVISTYSAIADDIHHADNACAEIAAAGRAASVTGRAHPAVQLADPLERQRILNRFVAHGVLSALGVTAPHLLLVAGQDLRSNASTIRKGPGSRALSMINNTLCGPLRQRGVGDARSFRHGKKYRVTPTPLLSMAFFRAVIDEAQQIDTPTAHAAKMTRKILALHRWCVSGTPLARSPRDLFGLLLFLGWSDFDDHRLFDSLVTQAEQGCVAARTAILRLAARVMWRTRKEDVIEELGIPPMIYDDIAVSMSRIERAYYDHEFRKAKDKLLTIIQGWWREDRQNQVPQTGPDGSLSAVEHQSTLPIIRPSPINAEGLDNTPSVALLLTYVAGSDSHHQVAEHSGIDAATRNKPLQPAEQVKVIGALLHLRQACVHPQIGISRRRFKEASQVNVETGGPAASRQPVSQLDVLKQILTSAKAQVLDHLRDVLFYLNALAGYHWLTDDLIKSESFYAKAIELIRDFRKPIVPAGILPLAFKKSCKLRADALQTIHAFHNYGFLLDLMQVQRRSEVIGEHHAPETWKAHRDSIAREEALATQSFLSKATVAVQEGLQVTKESTRLVLGCLGLVYTESMTAGDRVTEELTQRLQVSSGVAVVERDLEFRGILISDRVNTAIAACVLACLHDALVGLEKSPSLRLPAALDAAIGTSIFGVDALAIAEKDAQALSKARAMAWRVDSFQSIKFFLVEAVTELMEARKKAWTALLKILTPSDGEVAASRTCRLCRSDWQQTGPVCGHCLAAPIIKAYRHCLEGSTVRRQKHGTAAIHAATAKAKKYAVAGADGQLNSWLRTRREMHAEVASNKATDDVEGGFDMGELDGASPTALARVFRVLESIPCAPIDITAIVAQPIASHESTDTNGKSRPAVLGDLPPVLNACGTARLTLRSEGPQTFVSPGSFLGAIANALLDEAKKMTETADKQLQLLLSLDELAASQMRMQYAPDSDVAVEGTSDALACSSNAGIGPNPINEQPSFLVQPYEVPDLITEARLRYHLALTDLQKEKGRFLYLVNLAKEESAQEAALCLVCHDTLGGPTGLIVMIRSCGHRMCHAHLTRLITAGTELHEFGRRGVRCPTCRAEFNPRNDIAVVVRDALAHASEPYTVARSIDLPNSAGRPGTAIDTPSATPNATNSQARTSQVDTDFDDLTYVKGLLAGGEGMLGRFFPADQYKQAIVRRLLPIRGSFGSKIESLLRCLQFITRPPAALFAQYLQRTGRPAAALSSDDKPLVGPSELTDAPRTGVQSIVFSQWDDALTICEAAFQLNEITFVRALGGARTAVAVDKFIRDDSIEVLLMPFRGGAEGLNITSATHVFFLEPQLDPSAEAQASSRVYRMGQRKNTYTHRLLISNSVEAQVSKRGERLAQEVKTLVHEAVEQTVRAEEARLEHKHTAKSHDSIAHCHSSQSMMDFSKDLAESQMKTILGHARGEHAVGSMHKKPDTLMRNDVLMLFEAEDDFARMVETSATRSALGNSEIMSEARTVATGGEDQDSKKTMQLARRNFAFWSQEKVEVDGASLPMHRLQVLQVLLAEESATSESSLVGEHEAVEVFGRSLHGDTARRLLLCPVFNAAASQIESTAPSFPRNTLISHVVSVEVDNECRRLRQQLGME
jgi:hypothetical protein